MTNDLFFVYKALATPTGVDGTTSPFSVKKVDRNGSYFVGKDTDGRACLLMSTTSDGGRKPPPIRLESLDAQFELACEILGSGESSKRGTFTVVRCRSLDIEIIHYFLSVCEIIIRHSGDAPSHSSIAAAVKRIASIFQSIREPSGRSLNGLFGELYLIWRSKSPAHLVNAWRINNTARFDFAAGDLRLDVKVCSGRVRKHVFSYEQCNPTSNATAVLASMMIERIPGGATVANLIEDIEARISHDEDLILKLHEVIASTLGVSLNESLSVHFDLHLAENSIEFYDLREIPAVKESLQPGVTNVHFESDLTGDTPISEQTLLDREPSFWGFQANNDF